jgi:hypothetical protein
LRFAVIEVYRDTSALSDSLFSKFMDDVRNEAHQDHELNERHKAQKCIAVPGMSKQEIGVIGFHRVVPAAETRLRVGLERFDALCLLIPAA